MNWSEEIQLLDDVVKQIRLTRPEHSRITNALQGLRHYIITLEAKIKSNDKTGIKEKTFKNPSFNGNIKTSV